MENQMTHLYVFMGMQNYLQKWSSGDRSCDKEKVNIIPKGAKGQKVYFTQEKDAVEVRRHYHIALRIFFVLKYILSDINIAILLS